MENEFNEDFYTVSEAGRDFIKEFETGRAADGSLLEQGEPALTAYDDGTGVWTIGWGHTSGVEEGDVITRAQAEEFFDQDITDVVQPQLVEVAQTHAAAGFSMTQQQVDAVSSLAFNIGNIDTPAPRAWADLVAGDFEGYLVNASEVRIAGGTVLPGLEDRRADEAQLFTQGDYPRSYDHLNGTAGSAANPYAPGQVQNGSLTDIGDEWQVAFQNRDGCFLAGTEISMWDGSKKPIEEIAPEHEVVSYDKRGKLVPGRVTRVMRHKAKHILDVHGLMVTPGHVTYCADGRFAGQHVPMIDILRSDGALMREDGTKVRAGTGCELGTLEDRLVHALSGTMQPDGRIKLTTKGAIRLGTKFVTDDGYVVSVLQMIQRSGGFVTEEGLIKTTPDGQGAPYWWRFTSRLPNPEDYVLQRSRLTLNDIYNADEWEAVPPQIPLNIPAVSEPAVTEPVIQAGSTINTH